MHSLPKAHLIGGGGSPQSGCIGAGSAGGAARGGLAEVDAGGRLPLPVHHAAHAVHRLQQPLRAGGGEGRRGGAGLGLRFETRAAGWEVPTHHPLTQSSARPSPEKDPQKAGRIS